LLRNRLWSGAIRDKKGALGVEGRGEVVAKAEPEQAGPKAIRGSGELRPTPLGLAWQNNRGWGREPWEKCITPKSSLQQPFP
jgi:hypothetical protein